MAGRLVRLLHPVLRAVTPQMVSVVPHWLCCSAEGYFCHMFILMHIRMRVPQGTGGNRPSSGTRRWVMRFLVWTVVESVRHTPFARRTFCLTGCETVVRVASSLTGGV
jgi:hypothetical protein